MSRQTPTQPKITKPKFNLFDFVKTKHGEVFQIFYIGYFDKQFQYALTSDGDYYPQKDLVLMVEKHI